MTAIIYFYRTYTYDGGGSGTPYNDINATIDTNGNAVFGGSVTLPADPTLALEAATKQYVDTLSTGLTPKAACQLGTTANLVATYNNGASGVGATLTATSLGALSFDGVTPSVSDRILIKDQTTTFQNGIYIVTVVGDIGTAGVLTRSTDYDNSPIGEIEQNNLVPIIAGNTLAGSQWIETAAGPFTVGTTPIVFGAWSVGNYVQGAGITITGNSIAANVTTVAGRAGAVVLTSADVGLSNVVNVDQTNASNIISGTLNDARLPSTITKTITSTGPVTGTNLSGTNTGDQTIAGTGVGETLVKTGSGGALELKDLIQGTNITLTPSADGITIDASGGGGSAITDLTGDVTASGPGSVAATIANDAVTYAKIQNAAANTFIARAANSSGDLSEVALSASQLAGRGASGDIAPIVLGTNLSMSGTTLNASGGGIPINNIPGTSQSMAINNFYVASNASLTTATIPVTAAVSDIVGVIGSGAAGFKIAQNAGQNIVDSNGLSTTVGTGGSLQSTNPYCSAFLICLVANTTFSVYDGRGALTIV